MRRARAAIPVIVLSLLGTASRVSHPGICVPQRQEKRQVAANCAQPSTAPQVMKGQSFAQLLPVQVSSINRSGTLSIRLYDSTGHVDEQEAQKLDALLCDARDRENLQVKALDRRLLQLVFRAAYHFSAAQVSVVSAYRKAIRQREGVHAQARAIDFKLVGVASPILAAYLRTMPRVGVGIYTHPKTQFVHLDVREHSFHWLDASPPRRHWRERNISSKTLNVLDAHYTRQDDWPEGLDPPE
jgi:uncharacterized protein YcbK (DUF882 family)